MYNLSIEVDGHTISGDLEVDGTGFWGCACDTVSGDQEETSEGCRAVIGWWTDDELSVFLSDSGCNSWDGFMVASGSMYQFEEVGSGKLEGDNSFGTSGREVTAYVQQYVDTSGMGDVVVGDTRQVNATIKFVPIIEETPEEPEEGAGGAESDELETTTEEAAEREEEVETGTEGSVAAVDDAQEVEPSAEVQAHVTESETRNDDEESGEAWWKFFEEGGTTQAESGESLVAPAGPQEVLEVPAAEPGAGGAESDELETTTEEAAEREEEVETGTEGSVAAVDDAQEVEPSAEVQAHVTESETRNDDEESGEAWWKLFEEGAVSSTSAEPESEESKSSTEERS